MDSELLFWGAAAAMIVVALLFLLPPLLGKSREVSIARAESNKMIFQQRLEELREDLQCGAIDETDFAQAEADLQRDLLADLEGKTERSYTSHTNAGRQIALVAMLLVPLISLGLYNQVGSPMAIDVAGASERAAMKQGEQQFAEVVAQLEQKLEQNQQNSQGWLMLAKSYRYLGKGPEEVAGVYRRALERVDSPSPQLLMEYGEALFDLQGKWEGEPWAQLQRALEIDPQFADGLWFSGHIEFERGNPQQALDYWKRLAQIPLEDADSIAAINEAAARAQRQLGLVVTPLIEPVASTGRQLVVEVSLASAVVSEVEATDTVFVYARAIGRGGPPVAAKRLTVADLPTTVTLNDSLAMMPGNNLSSVDRVTVGAKITRTGVATAAAGELVATAESHTDNREPIVLVIGAPAE